MRKLKFIALLSSTVFALSGCNLDDLRVNVPNSVRPSEVVKLDQNWTEGQRQQFHHTSQGTRLMPVAWFRALEQPCFSPFGCGMLADSAYLSRFGFIPDEPSAANPDGFPIGFAVDNDFVDPEDKTAMPVVGLTCAACHTGELFVDKYAVQIEGAPAMIEVAEFQKALGLALGFIDRFPFSIGRYARFERRVLGANATDADKVRLKQEVQKFLAVGERELKVANDKELYVEPAGFIRTDALTRIGNQVFATDTHIDDNYAKAEAAVRYPQIWDSGWFTWVQYNSSIANPLVRNIGEALGLRAALKLHGADAAELANSVNIQGLKDLETLLSGTAPFRGLHSPKWPAEFRALDQSKAVAGAALYKQHCAQCHLPPPAELEEELHQAMSDDTASSKHWWRNALGNWFLVVHDVPLDVIGTDPRQATDFKQRTANTGDLGKGVVSAAVGLDLVTTGIAERFFREHKIPEAEQPDWMGGHLMSDPRVRDGLVYKARPLNGIWAAAPYLHNGSVPTLDALLSPDESARPSEFWLGSKEFDPQAVGYAGKQIQGASHYDTKRPGNSNQGHWFRDGPRGKGVIGPALNPDERAQIIEYLKTL